MTLFAAWQWPTNTKILWVTMLALADNDGMVAESAPELAKAAGLGEPECASALADLANRATAITGGWLLLNYRLYRKGAE